MIVLQQGINPVFVTLNERLTLTAPDILVNLTFRDETTVSKVVKTSDVSAAGDRLNEISLEVVATEGAEDLDNAKVFLQSGFYKYEIFESDDGTRNITGKTKLETGVLSYNVDPIQTEYVRTETETIYKG